MRTSLLTYLFALGLLAAATGCSKTEDPNCQSDTYWADLSLNGQEYTTLAPCADWYITVDTVEQRVNPVPVSGFYVTTLSNSFTINGPDTTVGRLRFDLFFFAPTALLTAEVNGTDTTRSISPENICALLDSNFHRLGNTLQDTVSVITNILFTDNAGYTRESFYPVANWQTSGYGFQPLEIEGVVNGECRTRFEMNALLSDSAATDSVRLFGKIRVPFK